MIDNLVAVAPVFGLYLFLFALLCFVVTVWIVAEDHRRDTSGPVGHIIEVREAATGLHVVGVIDDPPVSETDRLKADYVSLLIGLAPKEPDPTKRQDLLNRTERALVSRDEPYGWDMPFNMTNDEERTDHE